MFYFQQNLKKQIIPGLIIIFAIVSILMVSQYFWAEYNLEHQIQFNANAVISLYDQAPFRMEASFFAGILSGIIFIFLLIRLFRVEDLKKASIITAPFYLVWIFPLHLEKYGLGFINEIIAFSIPIICCILISFMIIIQFQRQKNKKYFKGSFLISGIFVLTLFYFGPLQIYLTNPMEFYFLLPRLIFYLIPAALFLSIFFSWIILLRSNLSDKDESLHQRVISIILALSAAFWIQGNLLVWNYGLLDGSKINWGSKILNGVIDSGVWILVILAGILFYRIIYRRAKKIAGIFMLIQMIFTILLCFQLPKNNHQEEQSFRRFTLNEDEKFTYSSGTNIIVFVLDEFQSNIFNEIMMEKPELKKYFDGFTYFKNNTGFLPFTLGSIGYILTGRVYNNDKPLPEFLKETFSTHSILKTLKDNRFIVDFYPLDLSTVYFDERNISNIKKRNDPAEVVKELAYLYDAALFRYVPHFIKRFIYNDGEWFLYRTAENIQFSKFTVKKNNSKNLVLNDRARFVNSISFLNDMLLQSNLAGNSNRFKFYHIMAVHAPLEMITENYDVKVVDYNKTNYKTQALAILKIVKFYLERLKELGAYDNSFIFFIADHGSGRTPDMYINPDSPKELEKTRYNEENFEFFKARGNPLMLVKKPGDNFPLKISAAPVSLGDIPITITKTLNIQSDFEGQSIFEIDPKAVRVRYFRASRHDINPPPNYINPMTEYEINGDSWLDSSWKLTGRVFNPPVEK